MYQNYYVIDAHVHFFPEKIAEAAVKATDRFYEITLSSGKGTAEDMKMVMARDGRPDHCVIHSVATTPKQVSKINTFIHGLMTENPTLFTGLGALHPDSADMEADVAQIVELGLHGVKMHPDIQDFQINDPKCMKMYELCEAAGLPILFHTGDKRYDNSNPNRVVPILKAFPKLQVIGAHFGGWSIWTEAYKHYIDYPQFSVDCSSSFYGITKEEAEMLIHAYGTDRVMFASDYPMWSSASELDIFMSLNLTDEERKKILSENAKRIYGIRL